MEIILCNKLCLYNRTKDETTIYGQSNNRFNSVLVKDNISNLVFCGRHPDFYIKLKGKISSLESITFIKDDNTSLQLENITLDFPFEDCNLQLQPSSAIITTMCKNYSHRLDEWIQYNLNLGFSGIVIFNNDRNTSNKLNEPTENCIQTYTTQEICEKYKDKVFMIDFPYSPLSRKHWNTIQRISFHIGVNAFRKKCRNIAFIDADEFIYIPNTKPMNIELFLSNYSTINIQSNILTNKNDNDIINNNILELAKYVGEDKYTKTILDTSKLGDHEFFATPHRHRSGKNIDKNIITHYHCWMNKRYKYNSNMPLFDLKLYSAL